MNKVITTTSGGLGNQLFQYAAGRELASRLDATLYINNSGHIKNTFLPGRSMKEVRETIIDCSYELEQFGIEVPVFSHLPKFVEKWFKTLGYLSVCATSPYARKKYTYLLEQLTQNYYRWLIRKLKWMDGFTIFSERSPSYSSDWEKVEGNKVYMNFGLWQSERYFYQIRDEIRAEYNQVLSRYEGPKTAPLTKEIKQAGSVCLHFRRGDFHKAGWLLPMDYYIRAIQTLKLLTQGRDLHFYIFTDDVEDLEPLLPQLWDVNKYPYTFVSNHKLSAYEEMMLITHCEHHVISNSTYAWWGAWLHDQERDPREGAKYVIAPKKWMPKEIYAAVDCAPWILV